MPGGWRVSEQIVGFGRTSAIETGSDLAEDQPAGLAVAGRWDENLLGETPPDDQLDLAAVEVAAMYGIVLLGPDRWNPREVSRSPVEIGGRPAGTASYGTPHPVDDLSPGYLLVTVVRADDGPLSFVVGFCVPEETYREDIERIHAGIGVIG